jgi:hypothetical protein
MSEFIEKPVANQSRQSRGNQGVRLLDRFLIVGGVSEGQVSEAQPAHGSVFFVGAMRYAYCTLRKRSTFMGPARVHRGKVRLRKQSVERHNRFAVGTHEYSVSAFARD